MATRLELQVSIACTSAQHLPVDRDLLLQAWVPRVFLPPGGSSSHSEPLISLPFRRGADALPQGTACATVSVGLLAVAGSIRSDTHSLLIWLSDASE